MASLWNKHKALYDNCAIHKALQKYGIENFDFSILELCSENELDDKEIYWINYYNSYKDGYNETSGGKRPVHTACNHPIEMYDLQGKYIKELLKEDNTIITPFVKKKSGPKGKTVI